MLLLHHVVEVMSRHDVRLTPFHSPCHAEEPDEIRRVGVEELTFVGTVDADGDFGLRLVLRKVLDVAEDVAASVLGDGDTKVGAEAKVSGRALFAGPLVDRDVLEEDEAAIVEEGGAEGGEEGS